MSNVSSVAYEGKCNFCENYIGETRRNLTIKWDGNCDIGKNSEPAKHLKWKIHRRAPNKVTQRKIHKASYVMFILYPK